MKRTIKFLLFGLAFGFLASCFTAELGVADEHEDHRKLEELEHHIVEVEAALDEAVQAGKAERAEDLRKEYDRLLQHAERLEHELRRDDDERDEHERHDEGEEEEEEEREHHGRFEPEHEEHFERHAHEMEMHMMELELEKRRMEIEMMRQEVATRTARFAADREASTAYAVQALADSSEHPGQAIEILNQTLQNVNNPVGKRIVRMKLAQLYRATGRMEEARDVFTSLVSESRDARRTPRREPRRRDTDGDLFDRGTEDRRGDARRGPDSDQKVMTERRIKQIFMAYDKNRDESVSFEEWLSMKEGDVTPDRRERENRLFRKAAGDDEKISPRELLRWMSRETDREG